MTPKDKQLISIILGLPFLIVICIFLVKYFLGQSYFNFFFIKNPHNFLVRKFALARLLALRGRFKEEKVKRKHLVIRLNPAVLIHVAGFFEARVLLDIWLKRIQSLAQRGLEKSLDRVYIHKFERRSPVLLFVGTDQVVFLLRLVGYQLP